MNLAEFGVCKPKLFPSVLKSSVIGCCRIYWRLNLLIRLFLNCTITHCLGELWHHFSFSEDIPSGIVIIFSITFHYPDYNSSGFIGQTFFRLHSIILDIEFSFKKNIIARTWKQPRYPSADEWIRKLWYIYTMEYYSAIKKFIWISSNEMDETGAHYTEWSKPER